MGQGPSKRILLIDGDVALHEEFRRILQCGDRAGCESVETENSPLLENLDIDSASHGPEGWVRIQEAVEQHRPYVLAVVGLDLRGEFDGVETVQHLWDEDPSLPILLCEAEDCPRADRQEVMERLGHIGRFLFLSKPLNPLEVRHAVAAQIDRSLVQRELKEEAAALGRALEQAREQAQAAGRVKEEFMANIGHEIRTPMNAILGFTRLLMKEPLAPGQLEKLRYVDEAGSSLLSLINNLLDYSKLSAGKLQLSKAPFNLESALAGVLEATRYTAREKELVVRHHVVQSVPRWLHGDSSRFRQILIILINNAIKFTDHGTIHLQITLDEQCERTATLRIVVTDTGIGIPAERQAAIFECFSQADGSSTRQYEGTGLGLSICKQLVDLMGGQIGFRSEPGQGSSFWLTITFGKQHADKEDDRADQGSSAWSDDTQQGQVDLQLPLTTLENRLGKPHVLVAEDDHLNRILAEMLLGRAGCLVELAENGEEALAMLNKGQYDLALMDLEMPRMDGLTAIKHYRRQEEGTGRHLPIVVLTACATPEDRRRCLDAGADEYVTKPFSPEMLIGTIRRHLPGLLERTEQGPSAWRPAGETRKLDQSHFLKDHLQALFAALEKRDFLAMESSAAAIKGLAATAVSKAVADHAMRVQLAARNCDLELATSAVRKLRVALQGLQAPALKIGGTKTGNNNALRAGRHD